MLFKKTFIILGVFLLSGCMLGTSADDDACQKLTSQIEKKINSEPTQYTMEQRELKKVFFSKKTNGCVYFSQTTIPLGQTKKRIQYNLVDAQNHQILSTATSDENQSGDEWSENFLKTLGEYGG